MGRRAAGFVLLLLCAMVLHVGLPHCGVASTVAIGPASDTPAAVLVDDTTGDGAYTANTVHHDDSDAAGLAVRSHLIKQGPSDSPGKVSAVLPDHAGGNLLSAAARQSRCPAAKVASDPALSGNLRC